METVAKEGYLIHLSLSSYRTYEEWKRNVTFDIDISFLGSYRTYEEWKRWSSA